MVRGWLEWFVTPFDGADEHTKRRAKTVVATCFVLTLLSVFPIVYLSSRGVYTFLSLLPLYIIPVVWLLVPFLLRVSRSMELAVFLALGAGTTALFLLAYDHNGMESPVLPWFAFAGLLAVFIVGARLGLLFVALGSFFLGIIYITESTSGPIPSKLSLDQLRTMKFYHYLLTGVSTVIVAMVYERAVSKTNKALGESERRFRSLVEQAKELLTIIDPEGVVIYQGPSSRTLLDREEADFLGTSFVDKIHLEDRASFQMALSELQAGEKGEAQLMFRVAHADGTWRTFEGSIQNLLDAPGINGFFSLARDITERLEAQKKEAYAQALVQTSRQFTARISHELRTPLSAILGYAELIKEDLSDGMIDNSLNDLEKIETAGEHLLHLINDFLDVTRAEAGYIEATTELFELRELLFEVVDLTLPAAQKNQNQLQYQEPPALTLYTDKQKLRQILFNLLGNACKFTKNGTIQIKTWMIEDAYLAIEIKDSGIGMTKEELSRIFEPFEQGHHSFGGTGLGLNITRRFCEMLGGDITVESEPGQGATFVVTLPLELAPLPEPEKEDVA